MSGFNENVDKTASAVVTKVAADAMDIGDFFTHKEEKDIASPTEIELLKQAPSDLFMLWTRTYSLKRSSSLYHSSNSQEFTETLKQRFRKHPDLRKVDDGTIAIVLWAKSHPTWRLFFNQTTLEQRFEFYMGNMVAEPHKIDRNYILQSVSQATGAPASVINDFLNKTQMRFSRFPVLSQLKFDVLGIDSVVSKRLMYVAISDDDALESIKKSMQSSLQFGENVVHMSIKNRFLPDTVTEQPHPDPEMFTPFVGAEKELFFIRTKWTAPQIMLFAQHLNNANQTPEEYFKNLRSYIQKTFPK